MILVKLHYFKYTLNESSTFEGIYHEGTRKRTKGQL